MKIRRQVQRLPQKGLVFLELKSSQSNRVVALGNLSIKKLDKHKVLIEERKRKAGEKWKEFGLIFPSAVGTPYEARNLVDNFYDLLDECELPKIRFHDLRHTAATLMFEKGIHPKVVQERLGHSTIMMTLDTYSHVIPSLQGDAAESLDEDLQ